LSSAQSVSEFDELQKTILQADQAIIKEEMNFKFSQELQDPTMGQHS